MGSGFYRLLLTSDAKRYLLSLKGALVVCDEAERRHQRTLDPEVDVLTAEADVVQHLAAVDARVVALQGPVEGEGVVGDLHAFGHRSVQPGQKTNRVLKVYAEIFRFSLKKRNPFFFGR